MKMINMIIDFFLLFSLLLSNSDAPQNRHGNVLVETLDGTVSFVDQELQTALWSVKIGGPIYSSYQASEISIKGGDNTYIDCGDDWNLYKYDSIKGTAERHSRANCLISEAQELSKDTTYVRGQLLPSLYVVVAHSGSLLRICNFTSDSDGFTEAGLWEKVKRVKRIVIMRNDYYFDGFSVEYWKTL